MKEFVQRGTVEWDELREEIEHAQAGGCAICREPLTVTRFLDHCHVTGFIRGVLCASCNTKLGWFEKRRMVIEEYLFRAAEYNAYTDNKPTPW